jgi:hypothetical protein
MKKYIEPLPEPRCGADVRLSIGEGIALACAIWVLGILAAAL